MRDCKITKKALSVLLALSMVLSWTPIPTHAADVDTCTHHAEHTADCGYVAAVAGSPCTHVCGETCVESCVHSAHDDTCGYIVGTEGTPCAYDCQEDHGTVTEQPEATTEPSVPETTEDAAPETIEGETIPETTEGETVIANQSADWCGNPLCSQEDAFHVTSCDLYVAPENPQCYCVEKCSDTNIWCDVCGFDYTQCGGTDTAAVYADCAHTTVTDGICVDCKLYGYCGATTSDDVNWSFDSTTGTLTISGTGAMADYSETEIDTENDVYQTTAPWGIYTNNITALMVTGSVTSVGAYAFAYCDKITSVELTDSITVLKNAAFFRCAFSSITLPSSLEEISSIAFAINSNLQTIIWPQNQKLKKIGENAFYSCTAIKSVKFPEGFEELGGNAFKSCELLETVVIPATVKSIAGSSFINCNQLSSVYYLGTSEPATIGENTFNSDITIYVPCTYTNDTFGGVTVTKEHHLDETTGICSYCHGYCGAEGNEDKVIWAFDESTGTLTISGTGAMANYDEKEVDTENHVYHTTAPWGIQDSLTNIVITGNITSIGEFAFTYLDSVKTVDLSTVNGLTTIGMFAFSDCKMESIEIPDSVTTIELGAFSFCPQLTSVKLPSNLESISESMFYLCSALTSITIPASVESLGTDCFGGCYSLATVTYLGTTPPTSNSSNHFWSAVDGFVIYVPCTYEGTTFGNNTAVINGHFEAVTGDTKDENGVPYLSYTAQGNVITQHCSYCGESKNETATITIADDLIYDGTNKVSVDYTDGWLGGKLDVIEAINADNYTASVTYGGVTASTEEFTITKASLTVTANDQTITYGESIAEGVDQISGTLATGDQFSEITLIPSTTDVPGGTITPSAAKIVNADGEDVTASYDITYVSGNLTINKAASSVTEAPAAVSGLIYTGKPQTLVSSGKVEGGTLVYSTTEAGMYGATIPTGTNAGNYEIWYKVLGDANHSDSTPVKLTAEIAQADASKAVVTVTGTYSYTSKEIIPATDEVTVTLNGKTLSYNKDYTFVVSNNTDVGTNTAIITVTFKGNYTGTATGKFTIAECPHSVFEDKKCTQCGGICGVVNKHSYTNGICVNGCYQPAEDSDSDGYYEIGNAGQLFWFAQQVNSGSTSMNAVLTANIVMPTKKSWTPIGTIDSQYAGIFDGKNHTISGLYYNDSNGQYIGLFGRVYNGTVRNVGVLNVDFLGQSSVGGIAGYAGSSTIENCFVTGTIDGTGTLGGVVGAARAGAKLKNCYDYTNVGNVTGDGTRATITNCYYLADSDTHDDSLTGTTAKTAAQFASGEVAYLLNGSTSEGDLAWGQTIGTDSYPVLGGTKVYQVTGCDTTTTVYSNTNAPGAHNYVNGKCTLCGHTIELISVDITWGAMEFTYTDGAWNAETHSYGEGSWSDNGTGWVTVENTGNTEVNVTYIYEQVRTDIEGSFTDGTNAITAPVAIPTEQDKTIWLILKNKPTEALSNAHLGTIKLTIE